MGQRARSLLENSTARNSFHPRVVVVIELELRIRNIYIYIYYEPVASKIETSETLPWRRRFFSKIATRGRPRVEKPRRVHRLLPALPTSRSHFILQRYVARVSVIIYVFCSRVFYAQSKMLLAQNSEVICYRCNRIGHFAKNCRETHILKRPTVVHQKGGGGGGGGGNKQPSKPNTCFKCHGSGHFARECKVMDKCFKCTELGHMARECPKSVVRVPICFKCRKEGHVIRDCTAKRRVLVTTVADNGDVVDGYTGSQYICYNCNKAGHISRDCMEGRLMKETCFKCQGNGHIARRCPNAVNGGGDDRQKNDV